MGGGQRDPRRAPRGSRVALFARYELGAAAGNAVAARALIEGLEERGVEVRFVGPSDDWRDGAEAPDLCSSACVSEWSYGDRIVAGQSHYRERWCFRGSARVGFGRERLY